MGICHGFDLSIIIPTWNNPHVLMRNLDYIQASLQELGALDRVKVLIGDDGSKEENRRIIEDNIAKYQMCVNYMFHENCGMEKNELQLIERVDTKYAMLLGEDDFLPTTYIKKVLWYLENHEVGVILANFYAIDEEGNKTNRACRNRIRKDRVYRPGNYKLVYLAHQMSGLVFQVEGLIDYYKKVPSNVYPQLSFVGHSIDKGINVHITDSPFACTVLRKRRFNYSVDGLAYDLLKNIISLPVGQQGRSKLFRHYLIKWSNQFCNPTSWRSPGKLLHKINSYELLSASERTQLKMTFLLSYITIPLRFVYRVIIIPAIGKAELKSLPKIEGVSYR